MHTKGYLLLTLILAGCGASATVARGAGDAGKPEYFEAQIRPLFAARCYECHGAQKQKNGLRLDVKADALRGGDDGPVILPGKSAESPLVKRVLSMDKDEQMPPKGERLTSAQIAAVRAWIAAGAVWPESANATNDEWRARWAFKPLGKSAEWGVRSAESGNPIDRFIDAELKKKGLHRSPVADPRTLCRRLYFDVTGLPPTPEQVDAFVAASLRNLQSALNTLIDSLLASPRYGEHWARHWLDVAHYADTHGNDHDYSRPNAWPYRDYVIRAFNEDKPYARFVQEQVAGDALFPDDPQATVALGFLAAGPWDDTLMVTVREDTVDHRTAQNLDRDDMVTTTMSAFQSLTVHCARCHNHKFDPISQREYYSLQAVFAGVDRADRPFDADPRTMARRRELLARKNAIAARDATVLASLDKPEVAQKVATATEDFARRSQLWQPLDVLNVVSMNAPDGTVFARQADGSWFVSGTRPEKDTFILTAPTKLRGIRALRLEVLPDDRLPHSGPGRFDNGNFHLSEFRTTAQPASGETKGAVKLEFTRATADHSDAGDIIANTLDGRADTYWSIHPLYGAPHEAVFELKEPAGDEAGTVLTVRLEFNGKDGHQIGRFRLSACTEAAPVDRRAPVPANVAALARLPAAQRTPEQNRDLALHILAAEVERELAALPAPQLVYAVTRDFPANGSFKPSPSPRPIQLLTRGDLNKPSEAVGPGALACVPGLDGTLAIANPADESARRAALARWLTDERNALTWRSIVNRVWHYHFGRGLCDTPNDFGKMGGTPSHPELLDALAAWFRDDAKGSLKALHRLILTSQTYRQTSVVSAEPGARLTKVSTKKKPENPNSLDSENRLLWRMNRTRLTGEEVRDAVLQFGGRLDPAMGGPAAVQFVQRGKATFMPDGGAPAFLDYDNFDPDAPENRRRAVYRFVFRTVPDPLMDAFDCPDGGAITPVRSVSTTALQAFAMLNDAFLIRQCQHIAERVAKDSATTEAQVTAAFRLMLQRKPSADELARFTAYTQKHGLANACHLLLNSNELLYVD